MATGFDVRVFLVGTEPLLMELERGREQDGSRSLRELAAETVVRNRDGTICLPIEDVLEALREAAQHASPPSWASKVTRCVEVKGDGFVPVLRPDGTPVAESDWEPDVQRGRNPSVSGAYALTRAKFPRWAVLIELRVDPSKGLPRLSADYVRQLFESARGLGAFRQRFGHFVVAEDGWIVTMYRPAA